MAEQVQSLANALIGDWDRAMDDFFSSVDAKRRKRGLSVSEAREQVAEGYGEDVADDWMAWFDND